MDLGSWVRIDNETQERLERLDDWARVRSARNFRHTIDHNTGVVYLCVVVLRCYI